MLHNILQFGFAGIAVLCLLGAWLSRAKRGSLTWAALCLHSNAYMSAAGDLWESVTRYHQKDPSDDSPENYTNPTYFSKIAFRMLMYPNSETKINSNIALWGQAYPMGRMLFDHTW